MFNHELYATSFARSVELLRDTTATKDAQKSSLRALVALSSLASATLRLYDGVLSVDDVSLANDVPHVSSLVERMQEHRVAEIMLGKGAEPRELLALVRAMAGAPGTTNVKENLRLAESKKIMVIIAAPETSTPRRIASVTQAFDLAGLNAPTAQEDYAAWKDAVGDGTSTSMREIDLGFAAAEAAAAAPNQPASAQPAPAPAAPEPERADQSPLIIALDDLAKDPYGRNVLDRLTDVADLVNTALAEDRVDDAVKALGAIVALEPGAPDGSPKNSYSIVLRRTLTREVLAMLAPHAIEPRLTEEVGLVLRRGRGDAAEVLLGLVANAEGIKERRAYMAVLRNMPQGIEQVVHMLEHAQWFVVRNVAELMGEVRLEQAVPGLGKCLAHSDHRVRRAAAVAMAKIGTPTTVEPLRRALREGDAELRALVATSIGRASRALAMPLVALIEEETDPGVVREYYCALGRIGSSEALRALVTAAEPGGKLLKRKGSAGRIAAVEGLRVAGAKAQLEALAQDGDRAVRDAVQKALKEIGSPT